ncbi:hypothetical protein DFJ73DRAFT_839007 [Zopfochytrium polystomum]|nr:hypothetical protein DFJ73DRAFT_839007 [Zopfochytrium polystomum]
MSCLELLCSWIVGGTVSNFSPAITLKQETDDGADLILGTSSGIINSGGSNNEDCSPTPKSKNWQQHTEHPSKQPFLSKHSLHQEISSLVQSLLSSMPFVLACSSVSKVFEMPWSE